MNTDGCLGFWIEQVRHLRIRQVRIGHHQRIPGKPFGISSFQQHGGGLTVDEVFTVLGVCEEAQLSWASLLQSG
ncbi:Uncharacterised protein [Mycobacterium tuberculosis]|nr:Uncharacterised protein [Mycobacterium tuberculosis]